MVYKIKIVGHVSAKLFDAGVEYVKAKRLAAPRAEEPILLYDAADRPIKMPPKKRKQ